MAFRKTAFYDRVVGAVGTIAFGRRSQAAQENRLVADRELPSDENQISQVFALQEDKLGFLVLFDARILHRR